MQESTNPLIICGLQKTTLLDYPGYVAATIFTGGCNFRCPFCHNSEILGNDAPPLYSPDDILAFLKKRKRILDGVCISGGELCLQPEALEGFILQGPAVLDCASNWIRTEAALRSSGIWQNRDFWTTLPWTLKPDQSIILQSAEFPLI